MREFKVGDKVSFKREYTTGCVKGSGVVSYIYPDNDILIKNYIGDGGQTAPRDYLEYNIKAGDRYRLARPEDCTFTRNSRITKKYT